MNTLSDNTALLDRITAMRGVEIYDLVSAAELQRAMNYYHSGRIDEFRWASNGRSLNVKIRGSGQMVYVVSISLKKENLSYNCPCPAFGRYSDTCKHVVAALFTICHIVKPSRFRPSPFSEKRRDILRKQITGTFLQDSSVSDYFDEVILCPDMRGSYRLMSDGVLPPMARVNSVRDWTMGADAREEQDESLLDWLQSQGDSNPLRVHVEGEAVAVKGVSLEPMEWVLRINAVQDAVNFFMELTDSKGAVVSPAISCSEHLAFLPDTGKLVWVPARNADSIEADLLLRISPREQLARKKSPPSFRVRVPIMLSYEQIMTQFLNHISAIAMNEGVILEVEGQKASVQALEPQYSIYIETNEGGVDLNVATNVGETKLSWFHYLHTLECEKYAMGTLMVQLFRAAGRRKIIQETLNALYLAETKKEQRAEIRTAFENKLLKNVRGKSVLKKYFNVLIKELWDEYPETYPCLKDGKPLWAEVNFSLRMVARLGALARVLFQIPPEYTEENGFWVDLTSFAEGLSAFVTACGSLNVPVYLDGSPARCVSLDISVQLQTGKELDWFELHPKVKAEGLELKQSEWEQLIRGELLRDAEKKMVLLDADSAEALRQVRSLMNRSQPKTKTSSKEPIRVPRLHIFDWLALERAGVKLDLPAADRKVIKSLRQFNGIKAIKPPETLKATLRPYQQTGLNWLAFLYQHRFGACLADDMGLGKTLQAIAFLAAIHKKMIPGGKAADRRLPHLIVVPPSLLYNWQHEIQQFYPDLKVVEYVGQKRELSVGPGEILLTTYDLIRRDIKKLKDQPFHVAIFDETQQVKNERSHRNRAVQQLDARFRLCLTGTPLENHVGEYFTIMELALPGLLEDARPFTKSVGSEDEDRYVNRTRPFILRRTKTEILKELPPKDESDVYLSMTRKQKELYTRAVGEVREQVLEAYADKTAGQAGIMALSALTRLRQICVSPALLDPESEEISPKLEYLQSRLIELKEEGHAALVFSQFTRALNLIEPELEKAGVEFVRLDGKTPIAKRKKHIQQFQDSDGPPVFLISLKAGGVGLNLTRASYVFHVDPWWNPAVEAQASDRAHRIGQKNQVFVNRILMHHSIEEKLMDLKARKREVFENIVEFRQKKSGGEILSRDDFDFLLS